MRIYITGTAILVLAGKLLLLRLSEWLELVTAQSFFTTPSWLATTLLIKQEGSKASVNIVNKMNNNVK